MKRTLFIAAPIFAALSLSAQMLPGMGADAAPAPAKKSSANHSSSKSENTYSYGSHTAENRMDKIFDFDSDSINLENGQLFWKGKTFEIGNSRVIRARFERYLATNFDDANFQNYQKILSQIISILSPNNGDLSNDSVRAAWMLLYDAAEYDVDNDGSLTIANTVYSVLRMRNEFQEYRISENEARAMREYSERKLDSHKRTVEKARDAAALDAMKIASKSTAKTPVQAAKRTEGEAQIQRNTKDLARAVANEATISASKQIMGAKSVLQFQSQIMNFLFARRFQHATISSYFYRHLYKGNMQSFDVGKTEFEKFYPLSNFMPNNDIIEDLAREARNDVREGMIAVNNLYDSGQRYTALMRLMEVFVLGENEASVRSFEYPKKQVLHELYRDLSTMKDMGDNRDFDGIIMILERVTKVASDFPVRETMSKIKTAQQASNLKIMAARAAAFGGDTASAEKNISEAAEIWPLNPELEKFTNEEMDATVGKSKYAKNFDENFERADFRAIMKDAPEYALALKDNPEKSKQLKEVISNVSQIDFLIAQSKELHAQGNSYIAWEMLEKAKEIDDADPVLARSMASLAPYVADYVKVLNRAKSAEKSGRYAEALNAFLRAQDIFPTSQECRKGIERCAKKTLDALE